MRTMNIAILIGSKKIGGSELQAALLARGLSELGLKVTIFCMDRPFRYSMNEMVDFPPVTVKYLWNVSPLRSFCRLRFRYLLQRYKIDILHDFNVNVQDPFLAIDAANFIEGPTIISGIRNSHFLDNCQYHENLKTVFAKSATILCNSKIICKNIIDSKLSNPKNIYTIYNGVFPQDTKKSKVPFSYRNDVLFIGSLKKIKDPVCFIESAIIILKKRYNSRFVIAGDGPMRKDLEEICHQAGYSERIIFLGNVPQGLLPFSTSRVFVSTSLQEGNSNSIIEALVNGVPVVATAVGGAIELLSDSCYGHLVPPKSPQQIALSIEYWLECSEEKWNKSSVLAQEQVKIKFSPKRMVDNHLAIYTQCNQRFTTYEKA